MKERIEKLKHLKNERGLTLVELLAVIVIIAVVAIIAFVFIGGVIENSKKDAHISNALQIVQAAKLHEATGGDANGMSVADLIEQDYLDLVLDPWTKKEYEDLENAKIAVEKVDGKDVLKITNFKSSEGECEIEANEIELSEGDRKELCK